MSECVTEKLRAGIERPSAPALNSRWWKEWRKEYGLSMRYPNRKYKCPLHVGRAPRARLAECLQGACRLRPSPPGGS
eukprot:7182243-Pyramimonas_sp.AAC.1